MSIRTSVDAVVNPSTTTRVYISHGRFEKSRGQTYNVHLAGPEGEQIVKNAFDPEYAACRALVARGVTGRLEICRPGSTVTSSVIRDIAKGAPLTIRDDTHRRVCVVKYRPRFEPDQEISANETPADRTAA